MTHETCATKADIERLRSDINDDIMAKYNLAIENVHKTAPETKREIDAIHAWITDHNAWKSGVTGKLDDLVEAFYGNEHKGEIGMKKQVGDMYIAIVQAKGIKGLFQNMLLVGGVSAMLYALFRKF